MKYSELISFNPIEDVIQLVTAGNKDKAREYVKTYVMSDSMAESLQAPLIDQLQMDEVVDNKGVLVVGNYGTGKSHLMSVISAIATDADNLQYLQNQKFAKQIQPIAGKFAAFGWAVAKIDGNDMEQVVETLKKIDDSTTGRPKCINAHTIKGKGVSFMENQLGWHGMAPNAEQYAIAMEELERGF